MNATFATYVTIGRNIGPVPMSEGDWGSFVDDVADAVNADLSIGGVILQASVHYGAGVWDGVTEESAIVSTVSTSAASAWLTGQLAEIAAQYGQDAIALVSAESALVAPRA